MSEILQILSEAADAAETSSAYRKKLERLLEAARGLPADRVDAVCEAVHDLWAQGEEDRFAPAFRLGARLMQAALSPAPAAPPAPDTRRRSSGGR